MTAAMTDERLADMRRWANGSTGVLSVLSPEEARELVAEVDRLRNALAGVYDLHVCIAPGARPMCDHDGEDWPCATIAAIGPDALYTRGDQ